MMEGRVYSAELKVDLYTQPYIRGSTLTEESNLLRTHTVPTPTRRAIAMVKRRIRMSAA